MVASFRTPSCRERSTRDGSKPRASSSDRISACACCWSDGSTPAARARSHAAGVPVAITAASGAGAPAPLAPLQHPAQAARSPPGTCPRTAATALPAAARSWRQRWPGQRCQGRCHPPPAPAITAVRANSAQCVAQRALEVVANARRGDAMRRGVFELKSRPSRGPPAPADRAREPRASTSQAR